MNIHPCTTIREAEQELFRSGVISSTELMSKVVDRLWQAVQQEPEFRGWSPRRVVVYAGRGNNAGDALGLAARFRCPITLRAVCPPRDFTPESAQQFAQLACHELSTAAPEAEDELLIIDGLLGSGATGALRPAYAELVAELNALRATGRRCRTLSIDVPTGLQADTGEVPGEAVRADVTAVIGCVKPGMLADRAEDYVGRLLCLPLPEVMLPESPGMQVATEEVLQWLPHRAYSCYKNRAGRVNIVAGSTGYAGAAQLCAEAALAAGAGLVALYCKEDIYPVLATRVAPEIMVNPISSYAEVPVDGARALVVGPGLGRQKGNEARSLHDLLLRCTLPMVVDADALNMTADFGWELPANAILTPHPGEMRRLFPAGTSYSRVECARRYTDIQPCTLVLKGARTVVTNGRETWFNSTGGPYMANGGQGDVLAGSIGALAAQGLSPMQAAVLGAWSCGQAAAVAAGQAAHARTIRASQVIAALPATLS